jgi:eukaryotic-like serine/threonine-protein kinase
MAAGQEAHNLSAVDVAALGRALGAVGAGAEALKLLREGQSRYPNVLWINFDMAHYLMGARQPAYNEAIRFCSVAVALHPESAAMHYALGTVFIHAARLDEAIAELRKAVELNPNFVDAHSNLGVALYSKGRIDEAIQEYRRIIELSPKYAKAHINLGLALFGKNQIDEAMQEYRRAIEIDPESALAHVNLGVALQTKNQLDEALQAYRRAVALDPKYAQAHCGIGYILRLMGKLTESLDAFRTGHRLGSEQPGWLLPSAQWVSEGERLIAMDRKLAAVLEGKAQPADDAERLALAQLCQQPFKKFYAASARLYSEALAHDAKLADDVPTGNRYNAACAAALAAAGQGNDADKLDDKERVRLRKQVVEWLRADLAYWTKQAASEKSGERERMRQTLKHWQEDADLSGLRDAAELAKLSADEQKVCKELWADVQTLLDKTRMKK